MSSHLSSSQSWWHIGGGKSCYIDRQYVHFASWSHLEPREPTVDDVDKDAMFQSLSSEEINGSANVTHLSYGLDSSK